MRSIPFHPCVTNPAVVAGGSIPTTKGKATCCLQRVVRNLGRVGGGAGCGRDLPGFAVRPRRLEQCWRHDLNGDARQLGNQGARAWQLPASHPTVGRPEAVNLWLRDNPDMEAIDGRLAHRLFLTVAQFPAMRASWLAEVVGGSSGKVSRHVGRLHRSAVDSRPGALVAPAAPLRRISTYPGNCLNHYICRPISHKPNTVLCHRLTQKSFSACSIKTPQLWISPLSCRLSRSNGSNTT